MSSDGVLAEGELTASGARALELAVGKAVSLDYSLEKHLVVMTQKDEGGWEAPLMLYES